MKTAIASDIHFEFYRPAEVDKLLNDLCKAISLGKPDVVVLAGDITVWKESREAENRLIFTTLASLKIPVVSLLGNHEFYGSVYEEAEAQAKALHAELGLHLLTPDSPTVTVAGQRFVGSTLWYPRPTWAIGGITDHRAIGNFPSVYAAHGRFMAEVLLLVTKDDILVTHHMPSLECINPKFAGSPMNHWFCTDIRSSLVAPKIAFHGHGHDPVDCMSEAGFRIYSNPFAYPGEDTNPKFWERLFVEV